MLTRRIARFALPAAVPAMLAGCSRETAQEAPRPPVHLSTRDPESNLAAIVDFVKKVCVDSINDPGAIAGAIEDARWPAEENQGSAGQMVDVRDLEHGRIAYSAIPFEAPGGRFRDCQIELDGPVAPSFARLRDGLMRAIAAPSLRQVRSSPTEIAWRWQPDPMAERELALTAVPARDGRRPGFSVHVSSTEYTLPPRAAAPSEEEANALSSAPSAGSADREERDMDEGSPPSPAPATDSSGSGRWGNSAASH